MGIDGTRFGEDYYENGVRTRTSGYDNYHWMPTRSFPEAISIMQHVKSFSGDPELVYSVLDVGCAKGFMVKALFNLGYDAWGMDISDYALEHADPQIKDRLYKSQEGVDTAYNVVICKDMLEHVEEVDMNTVLANIRGKFHDTSLGVFIIPLGDDDKFRIREYEIDVTHVTKKDESWWMQKLKEMGFDLLDFRYSMGDVKAHWVKEYPYGNGFFTVRSM